MTDTTHIRKPRLLRAVCVLATVLLLLPTAAEAKSQKHPVFDNITAVSQTGCPGDPVVFHVDAHKSADIRGHPMVQNADDQRIHSRGAT